MQQGEAKPQEKILPAIFCHICLSTMDKGPKKFAITNCQHIFCETCFTKNFCKICDKQCSALPINDTLPKNIQQFFNPNAPQELINTAVKIMEFQSKQQLTYVKKSAPLRAKYAESKKKLKDMAEQKKQLQELIMREKKYVNILKDAYHSKKITPEILQLGVSDVLTPQRQPKPKSRSSRSIGDFIASATLSRSSTCSSVYSPLARFSLTHPAKSNSTKAPLSAMPNNNAQQASNQGVMENARNVLMLNTMRSVNEASQGKSRKSVSDYTPSPRIRY